MIGKKSKGSIMVLLLALCGAGCAVFESGPLMMKQTGAMVQSVMEKGMDQLQISQMTASAGATVNDPRFRVHGFFGTGVRYEMYVELVGADMKVGMAAAGVGKAARNVERDPPVEPKDGVGDEPS